MLGFLKRKNGAAPQAPPGAGPAADAVPRADGPGEGRVAGPVILTRLEDFVAWGRKFSLFNYPFVTACCGMEYMSTAAAHNDMDRFGAAFPRFSPRQADLLMIVGTVNHKMSPVLVRIWEQMCEPKWVIAFGACATSGGFYDNYATVQGVDTILPVDVYIAGCPPPPESVFDAVMKLQERIQKQGISAVSSAQRARERAGEKRP
jgi:NADH-quinone oxidoreductase subunit B